MWKNMAFLLLFCLNSFIPAARAGVFMLENFHPGYRHLGRKNRDLGNREFSQTRPGLGNRTSPINRAIWIGSNSAKQNEKIENRLRSRNVQSWTRKILQRWRNISRITATYTALGTSSNQKGIFSTHATIYLCYSRTFYQCFAKLWWWSFIHDCSEDIPSWDNTF